jgi:hypothetical protein
MANTPQRGLDGEAQRRMIETLRRYIGRNGGTIVSPPGSKRLTVEVMRDSLLPSRLSELGYSVRAAGVSMKTTSNGFVPVDVIAVTVE